MAADDTMSAWNWTLPMKVSPGFRDFVLDQLSALGDVRSRPMFGGVGLYLDEYFFGLLADDTLFLKVDDGNRPEFVKAGSRPFKPYAHRPATMQYYDVPLRVLEDADVLIEWAKGAVAAARRKGVARPKRRR
jgi:DNA transformation protein and related proteins